MSQLLDWECHPLGFIIAKLVGSDKRISTSKVMKREGDVITTKTGSNYRLMGGEERYEMLDSLIRLNNK